MEREHYNQTNKEFNSVTNKGFSIVHDEFMENGWKLKKNEKDLLIYRKDDRPLDEFTIKVTPTNIIISVPIVKTSYSYSVSVNDYFKACDFISLHLKTVERHYKEISDECVENYDN